MTRRFIDSHVLSGFQYNFCVYVQLPILFLVFVVIILTHYMFWPNWLSSGTQIGFCTEGIYKVTAISVVI
jgi:hypothetical protein